ncbi:MAG: hypothetical protein ACHP84_05590 [Caulobacterales bacterium]
MRRRDLILALALVTVATRASAATQAAGQYVDLSPVALPVVVDGRLINYVFVSLRVNLTPGANAPHLREKEPYFRDALVRAGHRTPFTDPSDYTKLDDRRLCAAMLQAASVIAGPGMVASVIVTSETPKLRGGLPKPKGLIQHQIIP